MSWFSCSKKELPEPNKPTNQSAAAHQSHRGVTLITLMLSLLLPSWSFHCLCCCSCCWQCRLEKLLWRISLSPSVNNDCLISPLKKFWWVTGWWTDMINALYPQKHVQNRKKTPASISLSCSSSHLLSLHGIKTSGEAERQMKQFKLWCIKNKCYFLSFCRPDSVISWAKVFLPLDCRITNYIII